MAISQSHKLGELIGNFFEEAMQEPIKKFAKEANLYFDTIGPRQARDGQKVTWEDIDGNKHDLDYVLEKNGSGAHRGTNGIYRTRMETLYETLQKQSARNIWSGKSYC